MNNRTLAPGWGREVEHTPDGHAIFSLEHEKGAVSVLLMTTHTQANLSITDYRDDDVAHPLDVYRPAHPEYSDLGLAIRDAYTVMWEIQRSEFGP